MHADEVVELLVVAMPHTTKPGKLSFLRDNHPGIGCQVKAKVLPVRLQVLYRTTRIPDNSSNSMFSNVTDRNQFGNRVQILNVGCARQ